jgi:hypothetical protein
LGFYKAIFVLYLEIYPDLFGFFSLFDRELFGGAYFKNEHKVVFREIPRFSTDINDFYDLNSNLSNFCAVPRNLPKKYSRLPFKYAPSSNSLPTSKKNQKSPGRSKNPDISGHFNTNTYL